MKNLLYIIILIMINQISYAQCDIKTTNRPDGNTIKYFNPKPVIRQSDYEIGTSIYKNVTTNKFMVNISLLFKGKKKGKLSGNLTIQTTNSNGISLKPSVSELVEMNGRDVAIGLYELDDYSLKELSKYNLKSIFVYINGQLVGATTTENLFILRNQIECLQ